MSKFTGMLTIISTSTSEESSLNGDLLLLDGIDDTAQAIAAATEFLRQPPRNLRSGQFIQVTGVRNAARRIIRMEDAQAFAVAVTNLSAITGVARRSASDKSGSTKAMGKKTQTKSAKEKAEESSSKKNTKSTKKGDSKKEK